MTCKDCIHNEFCSGCGFYADDDTADRCKHFKDKSKFIELPCKIGDSVYWIKDNKTVRKNKVSSIKYESENEKHIFLITCRVFGQTTMSKQFIFDRTCWYTEKEAVARLKELQKMSCKDCIHFNACNFIIKRYTDFEGMDGKSTTCSQFTPYGADRKEGKNDNRHSKRII